MKKFIKDEKASGGGNNDIFVLAFALILILSYTTFLVFFNNSSSSSVPSVNGSQSGSLTDLFSTNFFDTITSAVSFSDTTHPEIAFLNVIVFGVVGILIAFLAIRLLRGS